MEQTAKVLSNYMNQINLQVEELQGENKKLREETEELKEINGD